MLTVITDGHVVQCKASAEDTSGGRGHRKLKTSRRNARNRVYLWGGSTRFYGCSGVTGQIISTGVHDYDWSEQFWVQLPLTWRVRTDIVMNLECSRVFFVIEIGPNHGLWVVCEPKGSQYDQYWFSHNDLQVRGRIRKIGLNCGLIIAGSVPKSKATIRLDHLEHWVMWLRKPLGLSYNSRG